MMAVTQHPELPKQVREVLRIFKLLDSFLDGKKYFCGNEFTLADISILPNVTTTMEMGLNLSQFKNLNQWHEQMKKLPGFDENLEGSKTLVEMLGGANAAIFEVKSKL
jgi:glutathione S-transferase